MQSRREFVNTAGSCVAHLALASTGLSLPARRLWAGPRVGRVVAQEPFGRLEEVAQGVWALVSTPLGGDFTTTCNGGIVAGRSGVLVVEGFSEAKGARWLAEQCQRLVGRYPTHCVLTHYHSDHVGGISGYADASRAPVLKITTESRNLVNTRNRPDSARGAALAQAELLSGVSDSVLDLGGQQVRIVPRKGHTPSDVTVELSEPSVVFCGDLVWNNMVPNYVDATPTQLIQSVEALRRQRETIYVPGHGPLSREADVGRYVDVLREIERGARAAIGAGTPLEEAARAFRLPASLGEWVAFNPVFYARAFQAWERELSAR